jgi:hypothetical protein
MVLASDALRDSPGEDPEPRETVHGNVSHFFALKRRRSSWFLAVAEETRQSFTR